MKPVLFQKASDLPPRRVGKDDEKEEHRQILRIPPGVEQEAQNEQDDIFRFSRHQIPQKERRRKEAEQKDQSVECHVKIPLY